MECSIIIEFVIKRDFNMTGAGSHMRFTRYNQTSGEAVSLTNTNTDIESTQTNELKYKTTENKTVAAQHTGANTGPRIC